MGVTPFRKAYKGVIPLYSYGDTPYMVKNTMINTQDILKITKLVLLSGYLKNHTPLSLFVVSKAGNGKTEIIQSYNLKSAKILTDLSYTGLLDLLKENTQIKHIIIPDFLKITMKKRSTSDNLVSLLNALTEEGIGNIRLQNTNIDFKGRKCGLIMATTKASYGQHKTLWENIGFVSRMIVCSYDYSDDTINKVISFINSDDWIKKSLPEKIGKYPLLEVKSCNVFNSQLNVLVNKKFRTLKHLQTLLKCHAVMNKRKFVIQDDVDEIIRLSQYLNLKYTKL